ncbi:platelet endothelial aggregation receptor 1-like [Haliotis cracherodii]|uniref:platelet endothelial aggregation receptor 1-like n=1 Tax=Haliotis cracherodii TaxID=6455 RepID=UPI0039E7565F
MNILTWTVGLHSIFQFVPVTSEVGGEHCGSNEWGPACDRNCSSNCRPLNNIVHCNVATGECLEGCNIGYHGTTCLTECNSNCINNTCNHVDGECSIGCKNGTSCTVISKPTNKSDTDITQTHCGFTSCLRFSVPLVIVIFCALSGLFVYAIWRRRRHKIRKNKRADRGPVEESVEMNTLDTGNSY